MEGTEGMTDGHYVPFQTVPTRPFENEEMNCYFNVLKIILLLLVKYIVLSLYSKEEMC